MTRQEAEQLVYLLAKLEAAGPGRLPPEYRRAVAVVRGLALVEVTFPDDGEHSVKVPRLSVVPPLDDRSVRGRTL